MNKQETAKLLAYIVIAYPNGKVEPNEPTVALWSQFTADLPYEMAKLAVDSMISTLRFPPTIADIRESVARARSEACGELSAGEAWGKVRRAVSRYGYYQPEAARECLGAALWAAIEQIGGWSYICSTEDDTSTLSAQFERRYKARAEQEQRRMQIPAQVQERMRELLADAPGLTLIEGGTAAGEG